MVPLASAAWLWPTSVSGGLRKSLSAVPSRRNSGFTETPNPSPYFFPDPRSSVGGRTSVAMPRTRDPITVLLPRGAVERRDNELVRRARKSGAAPDDDMIVRRRRELASH